MNRDDGSHSFAIRSRAVVTYTSVPGNLRRNNLPLGMGVEFRDLDDGSIARLRRVVAEVVYAFGLDRMAPVLMGDGFDPVELHHR